MKNKRFITFIQLLLALFILILGSQISFDLTSQIPFTAQSLIVLGIAMILGSLKSFIVILTYLILGILNFPVFANGAAGIHHFSEPSGGYLIGFLAAALVVGYLKSKSWDKNILLSIFTFIIGHILILFFGFMGIVLLKDVHIAWQFGVKPFILAAILKSIIGGLIMPVYYYTK